MLKQYYTLSHYEDSQLKITSPNLLNNLSDINFKHFMSPYNKCLAKKYYFLVNDTTLPSENLLRFRKTLLK